MGKVIRAQRIGKSPRRKSPGHRFVAAAKYPSIKQDIRGTVVDIIHDSGRTAPLAFIKFENGQEAHLVAQVGVQAGQQISFNKGEVKEGNVLHLKEIPEGTLISAVEIIPGDGGKIARAGGTFCRIVTRDRRGTVIQLPSGGFKTVSSDCLATVGIVAGVGRKEKPLLKAGKHFYIARSRNKLWPVVKGVNMNPVDHPYGGGGHTHLGKPKTVSRHAPPGRKIGSIAERRTGKMR